MSHVMNDDDDDGGAAAAAYDDDDDNTGCPVRMWGDTEVFGGLDSCGRAFTAHP